MVNKDILLFGANGQLGQELAYALRTFNLKSFTKSECNLLDFKNVSKILEKNKNSLVINASAYTKVDMAEEEYSLANQINAQAVSNLALGCNEHNSILVHFSTDYVFDGQSREPYKEIDLAAPKNKYGESKLLGEQYIQSILKNYYIFRTSWVYGQYGNNFPKTIIKNLKLKDKLEVVNDQFGVPTSTGFLSEVTKRFTEKVNTGDPFPFGIYNVVPHGKCSWFDLANEILNFYVKEGCFTQKIINPVKSDKFNFKARRPSYSVLCNDKIAGVLDMKIYKWQKYLKNFLMEFES